MMRGDKLISFPHISMRAATHSTVSLSILTVSVTRLFLS